MSVDWKTLRNGPDYLVLDMEVSYGYKPLAARVEQLEPNSGEAAQQKLFSLIHTLRHQGVACAMDYSGRKLNKTMRYANQIGAQYVAIVGDDELNKDGVHLKHMESGTSEWIPFAELFDKLTN